MYLKALEIQGFKSFPEKTTLTFENNITGIVGPNGSGKSNISDAILWVMGEQRTKTLRGSKMEDVIFGGTEKRTPLSYAQVTLLLDNSDHLFDLDTSEVSISRRYYRSGDSEYYINKEQERTLVQRTYIHWRSHVRMRESPFEQYLLFRHTFYPVASYLVCLEV